ncbi:MAG: GNAT family N-acetyltransferase, partial [Verrucomicrobiota bacterium]
ATPADVPTIHQFITDLAAFEKLSHDVHATESDLHDALFADPPAAEALLALTTDDTPAGFALYFHNYSTFAGKRGLYLEDLYVAPEFRNQGFGLALLTRIAQIAEERNCARFEWTVLDWNENAIQFYQNIGSNILPDWRICRMTKKEIASLANSPSPNS